MAMRRTIVDGRVLNKRTADMLHRAEQRLGYGLTVTQGSYNRGGVVQSAGTHDGGGALDLSVRNLRNINEVVKTLREVGFAAWHRLPSQGPWVEHIHAIAIGDPELSSGAASQVRYYKDGLNGLANHARDDGPRLAKIPVWPIPLQPISLGRLQFQFDPDHKNKKKVPAVAKVQELLNKRIHTDLKVDGIAGPKTVQAFKKYEEHIHAPAADGQPGKFSVSHLVAGYYRIVK
jgi:hypothetical protein